MPAKTPICAAVSSPRDTVRIAAKRWRGPKSPGHPAIHVTNVTKGAEKCGQRTPETYDH
jgi:hypothetical protein